MSSNNPWTWSAEHRRYYHYEIRNGVQVCIWEEAQSSQQQTQQAVPVLSTPQANVEHITSNYQPIRVDHAYTQAAPNPSSSDQASAGATSSLTRVDSISGPDPGMTPSAPNDIRGQIVFKGTPERGWYEPLDPSYRVRTRKEEYEFFTRGRVFAMLWSEAVGQTPSNGTGTDNTNFTAHPNSAIITGKFGENFYCSIRRFVIVRVNRRNHFVEACAITSYGNRGVLKPGCNPVEHTIVYKEGNQPKYIDGEYTRGMTKHPIAIVPADPNESISATSRLRLGKTFTIECNVKVRDIGIVVPEHLTTLLRYHRDSRDIGFEPDDWEAEQPLSTATSAQGGRPPQQSTQSFSSSQSYQSTGTYPTQTGYPPSNYQSAQGYQNPPDHQNTNIHNHQASQGYQNSQGHPTAPGYYVPPGYPGYQ